MEQDTNEKNSENQEVVEPESSVDDLEKKKKRDLIFEMTLFFILGVLIGITVKTEAVKKITIGFNDYQIVSAKERYDIGALKKNLEDQIKAQAEAQEALQNQAQVQQNSDQQINQ
jgi:hypothetical protein